MNTKSLKALPNAKIRFIEPMYALAVQSLTKGKEWLYEIKLDGYRALAGKEVTLWSQRGNHSRSSFRVSPGACERLPLDTPLDCEILALDENGRTSFNLLLHHHPKVKTQ